MQCSAYTHVLADTLRSLAVIVAALVAKFTPVTPEESDATAAVVVSVLIMFSLLPLFKGMVLGTLELFAIRREEVAEKDDGANDIVLSTQI